MAGVPTGTPRHWPESHLTGITLIAAALMLVAPLWCVWAPAMPDYPAHLASFALIEQGTFHHGVAMPTASITCTGASCPIWRRKSWCRCWRG